jgi:hypothetical protein
MLIQRTLPLRTPITWHQRLLRLCTASVSLQGYRLEFVNTSALPSTDKHCSISLSDGYTPADGHTRHYLEHQQGKKGTKIYTGESNCNIRMWTAALRKKIALKITRNSTGYLKCPKELENAYAVNIRHDGVMGGGRYCRCPPQPSDIAFAEVHCRIHSQHTQQTQCDYVHFDLIAPVSLTMHKIRSKIPSVITESVIRRIYCILTINVISFSVSSKNYSTSISIQNLLVYIIRTSIF